MESVPKITIFGLKMMSNSLENFILKFLHSGRWLFFFVILRKTPAFYEVKWIRRKWLPHGGISKIFFVIFYTDSNFRVKSMVVSQPYSMLKSYLNNFVCSVPENNSSYSNWIKFILSFQWRFIYPKLKHPKHCLWLFNWWKKCFGWL